MESKLLEQIKNAREVFWENPKLAPAAEAELSFSKGDIEKAADRLQRFAPLILRLFPETRPEGGLIESPLKEIEGMKKMLSGDGENSTGRLLLKCDSHLAVAGSVKARGGIYEVLLHTEELALQAGLLSPESGAADYAALAEHRSFFKDYTVQVGSTGNLGMSIGIMSAAIGYHAVVHMSKDAREWKKKLLRSKGVEVIEYESDYGKAVEEGRRLSEQNPKSYFVDDESSGALYLGYAVAGKRLIKQLEELRVTVDEEHPLYVYIPCGVGGAPGGITFGLKMYFGDGVKSYFVEPVQAPCMLLGLATGRGREICVQDYGLTGKTEADGLAVSRPSGLVAGEMEQLLSGCVTVRDEKLYEYMKMLHAAENIIIEPSACAAFAGYEAVLRRAEEEGRKMENAAHIIWATGGSLMPKEIVSEYLSR